MLICQMFVQQFSPDTSLCGKNHDEFTWAFRELHDLHVSQKKRVPRLLLQESANDHLVCLSMADWVTGMSQEPDANG